MLQSNVYHQPSSSKVFWRHYSYGVASWWLEEIKGWHSEMFATNQEAAKFFGGIIVMACLVVAANQTRPFSLSQLYKVKYGEL